MMWYSRSKVMDANEMEGAETESAADHELSQGAGHGLDVPGCVAELCDRERARFSC